MSAPYKGEFLAAQLRHARENAGLSQRALSAASGLSQSHISLIERGALEPGLGSLVDIARALDLEPVLVPRKLLPAVEAIIAPSSRAEAPLAASLPELARTQRTIKRLRALGGNSADLDKIRDTLRVLHSLPLNDPDKATVAEILDQLARVRSAEESRNVVKTAAEGLQALRNWGVHSGQSVPRPAYSLDEDDDA